MGTTHIFAVLEAEMLAAVPGVVLKFKAVFRVLGDSRCSWKTQKNEDKSAGYNTEISTKQFPGFSPMLHLKLKYYWTVPLFFTNLMCTG